VLCWSEAIKVTAAIKVTIDEKGESAILVYRKLAPRGWEFVKNLWMDGGGRF